MLDLEHEIVLSMALLSRVVVMCALCARVVRTSRRSSPTSAGTTFSCIDHACAACSGGSDESPEFSDVCRYYFLM